MSVVLAVLFVAVLYGYGIVRLRRRDNTNGILALFVGTVLDWTVRTKVGLGRNPWTMHGLLGFLALLAMTAMTLASLWNLVKPQSWGRRIVCSYGLLDYEIRIILFVPGMVVGLRKII